MRPRHAWTVIRWIGIGGIALIVAPLVSLVLVGVTWTHEYALAFRAGAVALWMALWWMTEAVPLAVTALLPLVLLPAFGVLTSSEVPPVCKSEFPVFSVLTWLKI